MVVFFFIPNYISKKFSVSSVFKYCIKWFITSKYACSNLKRVPATCGMSAGLFLPTHAVSGVVRSLSLSSEEWVSQFSFFLPFNQWWFCICKPSHCFRVWFPQWTREVKIPDLKQLTLQWGMYSNVFALFFNPGGEEAWWLWLRCLNFPHVWKALQGVKFSICPLTWACVFVLSSLFFLVFWRECEVYLT